tara:strand:- start:8201 stop:9217 length:1017 start_codon:yes stop_codon:yes gene_type:complete
MYIENNIIKNQMSFWLASVFWVIVFMIFIGGLTRLTDSGLSITKWELFSGFLPPLSNDKWIAYFDQYKIIPEFKLQNYSMTLEEFKIIFWWEWIHRFLGRLIGIIFLIPLIFFTLKLGFKKLVNHYLIFCLICFQGFIGWYMVTSGLVDRIDVSHFRLSIHLVMAFFILSLVLWNYFKLRITNKNEINLNNFFPYALIFLIFLQITIGAFVSGMDAGKIYNSWPLMGSSYFPNDSEIDNLFHISALSEPSLVQFLHRNLAYVILLFYLFILFKIYKQGLKNNFLAINLIGFFLLLQIILGIFTLVYSAQIILASIHQVSSIFLVSSTIYFLYINKKTS